MLLLMGEFLPEYRRGMSITGYVMYCSARSALVNAVPNISDRRNICKDHASQARNYLRQPN